MAVVGPLRSGYKQDRTDKRQGTANRSFGSPFKSPLMDSASASTANQRDRVSQMVGGGNPVDKSWFSPSQMASLSQSHSASVDNMPAQQTQPSSPLTQSRPSMPGGSPATRPSLVSLQGSNPASYRTHLEKMFAGEPVDMSWFSPTQRQMLGQSHGSSVDVAPPQNPTASPLATTGQLASAKSQGLVSPNQMTPDQVRQFLSSSGTPTYDEAQANPLGVITSPLESLSPEDRMRVAQQREAARALGGTTVNQAAAVAAGRRDAQDFANRSPQEVQQARLTAAGAFSPLAGEAGNFQAMNAATEASKAEKDAAWTEKMEGYKVKKNADENNNGVPDRDEAVATKYGTSGINSINDLTAVNAKYNVYMRGYKSNPEAMASSRPMTFDEFAKANHAEYGKRPVYGAEPSAGNQEGVAQSSSPLLGAIEAGRQAARNSRAEQEQSPVTQQRREMAGDRVRLTNMMGQAMNMGYSRDQAAQIARSQMNINQQVAGDQAVRNDAMGLEQMKQQGRLEQLRMEASDPTKRVGLAVQIQQLNPTVIAQQAGQQAAAELQASNPTATAQQLQQAGARAQQAAYAQALPMWQAVQSDPIIRSMFQNSGSPLSQGGTRGGQTVPSPLAGAPEFDMTGGTGAPIVPGADWEQAPMGTGGQIRDVERKLTKFLGRPPTQAEMEEQILAEGGGFRIPENWQPSSPLRDNSGALESGFMF